MKCQPPVHRETLSDAEVRVISLGTYAYANTRNQRHD
jgi:hypothetical protein